MLVVQSTLFGTARRSRGSAFYRRDRNAQQQLPKFVQAVLRVASLITVTLTGDQQYSFIRYPAAIAKQKAFANVERN